MASLDNSELDSKPYKFLPQIRNLKVKGSSFFKNQGCEAVDKTLTVSSKFKTEIDVGSNENQDTVPASKSSLQLGNLTSFEKLLPKNDPNNPRKTQIDKLKSLEEAGDEGPEQPIERWRTTGEEGGTLSNDDSLNIEDFAEGQD